MDGGAFEVSVALDGWRQLRNDWLLLLQWRTGPPGNREISRWAPASGISSGPRPYMRIYFIDNQLTQSADRLSIHRAGGNRGGQLILNGRFAFLAIFVGLRATYNVHLMLEVDFLLVIIELFFC